jgi:hypothetical protein
LQAGKKNGRDEAVASKGRASTRRRAAFPGSQDSWPHPKEPSSRGSWTRKEGVKWARRICGGGSSPVACRRRSGEPRPPAPQIRPRSAREGLRRRGLCDLSEARGGVCVGGGPEEGVFFFALFFRDEREGGKLQSRNGMEFVRTQHC